MHDAGSDGELLDHLDAFLLEVGKCGLDGTDVP